LARRIALLDREVALAVAERDDDLVLARVADDDVGKAVAVEIADREPAERAAARADVGLLRRELALAVAGQDAERLLARERDEDVHRRVAGHVLGDEPATDLADG